MIENVLLINPNYQKGVKSIAQISIGPPLGLAYIAAVLERLAKVDIIDANALNLSDEGIINRVKQFKPDLIGFTAVTPTISIVARLAKKIKENIKVPIVIGGSHASLLPKETLERYKQFDFLVKGEGEFTFFELIKTINDDGDLKKVKGLFYRGDNGITANEPRELIEDLDILPFPARHLLPNDRYRTIESANFNCIMTMRGCPARCIYCNVYSLFGNKLRKRSVKNVVDEMEYCYKKFNTKFISFLDDTFTYDKNWVFELCDEIKKRGLKIRWSCLTRVDNVSEDLLKEMKKAGCSKIELGIESGSQRVLDYMKKGITVEQIKNAFRLAKKVGIPTFGFIILNMPVEDRRSLVETSKLIFEINPDFLQISYATPYPGTYLYSLCKEQGLLKEVGWDKYVFLNNVVIKNNNISEDELIRFKKNIERRFYTRPSYLIKTTLYGIKKGVMIKTVLWAGINALKELFGKNKLKL